MNIKIQHYLLVFSLLCIQTISAQEDTTAIDTLLNRWHRAAGQADFDTYFGLMSDDAIFVGTDAAEHWNKQEFMSFSKPHFDKGSAWDFTAIERHIYFNQDHSIAWFDEVLDTWMELCRGSGVATKINGTWKITHYVLSVTAPNEEIQQIIPLKKASDTAYKAKLKQ